MGNRHNPQKKIKDFLSSSIRFLLHKLFPLLFTAEHAGFFLRDLCALRGDKKYFAGNWQDFTAR
jgi:hypothetical protein